MNAKPNKEEMEERREESSVTRGPGEGTWGRTSTERRKTVWYGLRPTASTNHPHWSQTAISQNATLFSTVSSSTE